jgi:hypothetical protein
VKGEVKVRGRDVGGRWANVRVLKERGEGDEEEEETEGSEADMFFPPVMA